MNVPASSCTIAPTYIDGRSEGKFVVSTDIGVDVPLQLFSGESSSVDYIVLDANGSPILLIESTQTTDKDSRNTAWNQRVTKFSVCKRMIPNARKIMYYTDDMSKHTSGTADFGMRLLSTMGVEMWNPGGQLISPKFVTVEELVTAKNRLADKSPSHNVPVRLEIVDKVVVISGRLNKTAGRMDNDPNIGLFSGIINAVHEIDPSYAFKIINHRLDVTNIREKNKFWFGVRGIDVTIDGFNGVRAALPTSYLRTISKGEKLSTILFQHQTGLPVAFHNHAGCQRSAFKGADGVYTPVPKKVTMPDVVLVDLATKTLFLTEGKDSSKVVGAQNQLDNLQDFMKICDKAYPGFTLQRGLCLYLDKPIGELRFPVWFALSPSGVCTKTFPA